jgi:hypothetical protein
MTNLEENIPKSANLDSDPVDESFKAANFPKFRWVFDIENLPSRDDPGLSLEYKSLTPYADCPGLVRSKYYAERVRSLAETLERELADNIQVNFERSPFGGNASEEAFRIQVFHEDGSVEREKTLRRYPGNDPFDFIDMLWPSAAEYLFMKRVEWVAKSMAAE